MLDFRLNVNEPTTNFFKLPASQTGCCGSDASEVTYTATVTLPVTGVTVVYKGADVDVTFDNSATTEEELYTELAASLKKPQDEGGAGIFDFPIYTKRGIDIDTGVVTLKSAAEFKSIEDSTGTVVFVAS